MDLEALNAGLLEQEFPHLLDRPDLPPSTCCTLPLLARSGASSRTSDDVKEGGEEGGGGGRSATR